MSGRSPPLYCTLALIAMQGYQKTVKTKQRQCSTPSHMVVVIYYYICYKYKATTWYLIEFPNGVCVCVFFPFILGINFVGRTSRGHTGGRSHRISHPPSFCGACLNFSREKDSAIPFPRRPCSRILCTNDLIVLHPLGIFIFVF